MHYCPMKYTVQMHGYTHKWECGCVNCACYIHVFVLVHVYIELLVSDSIVGGVVEVFSTTPLPSTSTWCTVANHPDLSGMVPI